ncbi:septation protein SepH [Nesterenkonia sphaerica]|uniref:DUF3071 domain-containing protein n=1 Tax=Nesterenkonia sphaerica TaxID=1804988 RepID=A0A5R9ANK9_9MICC|nr:septation protein SepH [Nesterenkonia sphaerica]TLP79486.1 DUF3071 domain-containing protein [Nesterenkonia sphaerica]
MQDLRIVGVDPGTQHQTPRLLLSDGSDAEYGLPVDESLRAALARASAPRDPKAEPPALSPRAIQARLRGGATVEEVVADSGLSREHILRYAGPVTDERAYRAARARETVVARASTAEQHRLAFGDAPATLEAMVMVRLRAMGVTLESMSWDAWRREDGRWAVTCNFDAASSETHAAGIGQQPPAEWTFDPAARTVRPENKWAESLSALPPTTRAAASSRRLAAVDKPFNVDDHQTSPTPGTPEPPAQPVPSTGDGADHEDLLDILRARRGQRLGTDASGDDKLATLLTRDEQPVRPPAEEQRTDTLPGLEEDTAEPVTTDDDGETDSTDAWGFSYDENSAEAPGPSAESDEEEADPPRRKKRSSSRRPTMPRWDDILFGHKE